MLERFNAGAREAVAIGEAEARRFGHGHVGTEHLLLGILADSRSRAGAALLASGATLDAARKKVGEITVARDGGTALEPQLSDRARRAIERADRLSLRRRDPDVDTEHLLTAVLDMEGRAGQVLRSLAVDLARLRESLEAPGQAPPPPPPPTRAEAEPRCPGCGANLKDTLAHRRLVSTGPSGQAAPVTVVYCRACGTPTGVLSGGEGEAEV